MGVYVVPPTPLCWVFMGIVLGVLAFVIMLVVAPEVSARIVLENERLCAKMFGFATPSTCVSISEIARAEVVKELSGGLKPVMRVNGFGLPGFFWGWFKLADGHRAFLAISSAAKSKYLVLQLRDGDYIIIKCRDLPKLVAELQSKGVRVETT